MIYAQKGVQRNEFNLVTTSLMKAMNEASEMVINGI
jgi:hypothetical protein